ncbi:MAG: hypothetical protein ACR2O4_08140 [Hyphomicrobiaceae bacterium]
MSTTIWPIVACVALLAASGWWIGRQFAADISAAGPNRLTVVMADRSALGRDTVRHLVKAARDAAPSCTVTICYEPTDTCPSTSLNLEHFQHDDGSVTFIARQPVLQTDSAAIRHITLKLPVVENDWYRLAAIVLANGGIALTGTLPDQLFEHRYLSAWCAMRRALEDGASQQMLERAHRQLRGCIEDWPEARNDEKPVGLANLARVCLAMPGTPVTRVPRLLEGFDAAREAIRTTYDVSAQERILGLRALLNDLRCEIGDKANGPQAGSAKARIAPRTGRHAFAAVPYPHHRDTTGHGSPRIRP